MADLTSRGKPNKQYSVWEEVRRSLTPSLPKLRSTARYAYKHRAWPNPFKNAVRQIDSLACEHTWQGMIEMGFAGFGNWAFSAFVPSPVELTRKFVAGSYRCGFYMTPGVKSPLDIIWRDGKTSRALAEIAAPLTTGLFYMWAGQTFFDFINTWGTLVYAQEMCGFSTFECLLASGTAAFGGGTHHEFGDVGLYTTIYDPLNRYPELGGGPADNFDSKVKAFAVGYINMALSTATNARIWIYAGVDGVKQELGTLLPTSATTFHVQFEGIIPAQQAVVVRFEADITGDTILPNIITVVRFTSKFNGFPYPPFDQRKWDYNDKSFMCGKLYDTVYHSSED